MTGSEARWKPVVVHLTPSATRRLARIARVWVAVAVIGLAVLAATIGVPLDPEGGTLGPAFAEPLQYALLGVEVVALALSWRWKAIETLLLAFGGVGLAVLAAYEYRPLAAALVAFVFVVPAVLLWLAWHPRESLAAVTALGLGTTLVLGGAWIGATAVYDSAFGPTHPESTTASVSGSALDWMWAGAVDTKGFTVVAGGVDGDRARLVVVPEESPGGFASTAASISEPVIIGENVTSLSVTNLQPGTRYRYAIEVDGKLDTARVGRLTTFPEGPASLTIAVSSCARTGSNGRVFDAIARSAPDLYVITGDFHYQNIERNEIRLYQGAYDAQLQQPAQTALYANAPIAYVWDDHDFGPNDAVAATPSAPAARSAYEMFVPHYPLSGRTIHQAFTMGTVRFVVTDTRSARDPAAGTMLGHEQLDWLLTELLDASRSHALVLWVNPTPWISDSGADTWAGYADERRRISDFIAAHDIDNLVMLSGDAHMVAIDDGSNNVFSSQREPSFPVFHAAPLDRPGSEKGGPYSHGVAIGSGQYGLLMIDDDGGDSVEVTLEGRDYTDSILMSHTFSVPASTNRP